MNVILTIPEVADLEKRAFAEGVDAWDLMQDAGQQMAQAIRQNFPERGRGKIYVGKGNNGGDALVVAACLQEAGWQVEVVCPVPQDATSLPGRAMKLWENSWGSQNPTHLISWNRGQPLIVVDGVLGIGAQGEVRPPFDELIRDIQEKRENGAVVFALDVPTGLGSDLCVTADHTLAVGFAKDVLLGDKATDFVGRLSVLPLEELSQRLIETKRGVVATAKSLRHLVPPRSFDQHKGQCGRVAIVAGSLGTVGAAVLTTRGALHAGAGLVSLFCPPEIYPQLASMLPAEVMARPWGHLADVAGQKFDVLAIGPGLAASYAEEVLSLIYATRVPLVLDAGALGMVTPAMLDKLSVPILLTPHPGEMEHLFPANGRSRAQWASDFAAEHAVTLLLKGSRTIVSEQGRPLSYNTTGHPGMATGGMGDTLTGVCAALIGQKLSPYDAARVGAWICGRAAEIAVLENGESQESLLPTALSECLGKAFADLRLGIY